MQIFIPSGGNAARIKREFDEEKGYSLAWHLATARSEPVYLFVHKNDYGTYSSALQDAFAKYRNLYLVGWDGGAMTGFGAARSAALAYADRLPYEPQRIIMMDQDVVPEESTRHTSPDVVEKVKELHGADKPVIVYGLGFPTRTNTYWTGDRVKTLKKLNEIEKDTQVVYESFAARTLGELCDEFVQKGFIKPDEKEITAALIFERIIIRAYQKKNQGTWPPNFDGTALNRLA